MNEGLTDIKEFPLFQKACEGLGREELKEEKRRLISKKEEIDLQLEVRDLNGSEGDEFHAQWKRSALLARAHFVRKMSHIDNLLSKSKGQSGHWLMRVIDWSEPDSDAWMLSTVHPVQWLVEEINRRVEQEMDPHDIGLDHFWPLSPEQFVSLEGALKT